MKRRTVLPLAATALLLAACAESPTGISPDASPRAALRELQATATLAAPPASGCVREPNDSYVCLWSVSNFQNIRPGAEILVSSYLVFGADYVCANPKRPNARPKAGGSTTEQITGEAWYPYSDSMTVAGKTTLTPALPKHLCKGSFVPRITRFYPISAGVNANQVWEEDGNTHYGNLQAETFATTGTIDHLTSTEIAVAVFGGGSGQVFGLHPEVTVIGDADALAIGASATLTYYGGYIVQIEVH